MIDIGTVLKKLNNSYNEESQEVPHFGIRFIDRNGLTHEYDGVRKNVKNPKIKQRGPVTNGKAEVNLKRNGIVMLHPSNSNHPITPKACMIYGFRDHNSPNWLNVFH